MGEINTINDFLLGTNGESFGFLIPPAGAMSKEQALRTAAWLVALADPLQSDFPAVLKAVMGT